MIVLILALVGVAAAVPQGGFSNFLSSHNLKYSGPELKFRLGLFQQHVKEIEAHNAHPNRKWEAGVNNFAVLTDAERKQFLGLGNISEILSLPVSEPSHLSSGLSAPPASIDHTSLSHVTNVKDQGGCGSCWAFGAVASFEGSYAIATKELKVFAEQEVLDCTYPDSRNGCNGGWYQEGWAYIQKSKRLGLMSEIPYKGKDGPCSYSNKKNGAFNVKYTGYERPAAGDGNLVAAAAEYVPAVAITVENDFFSYQRGWYDGCDTPKSVNHAVTVVGYDPGFWMVKNSWGSGWGEGGYVRMAREKPSICKIANYVMYPKLEKIENPWIKVTNYQYVSLPATFKKLKLKVKCQADGVYERIKVFTYQYNKKQVGHIELITHGLNDSKFSLFCKGAGNRRWYGGARYFGTAFSNAARGGCDASGFREYEYEQFSDRYEARVGTFVQKFSSRSRGRCNVRFNQVMFEIAHAPEAFYKWES